MPTARRATVYLDADLHRALRVKAAETDKSISDLVNTAVRLNLAEDADDLVHFAVDAQPHEPLGAQLFYEGFLLALPFMLLFDVVAFFIFGFGAVLFLVPFAPFALLAFLLWRWMRGRPRAAVSA